MKQFFIHIGHELSFTLPLVKSKYRMVLMKGCVLSKSYFKSVQKKCA